MSESLFPPFLHWGDYTSKDEKQPDVLNVEVLEIEPFDTEYGKNVRAKVDGIEKIIPLKNFSTNNIKLLNLWIANTKKEKIKQGVKLALYTWLRKSKQNTDRDIRDWKMEF